MKPIIFAMTAVTSLLVGGAAHAVDDVMVVFDGSNSMWGQIEGVAKIEIARDAMENLMGDWTAQTNLGLMAYGHRKKGDCSDIETIIPPGPADRAAFLDEVRQITPRGKTPLSAAIERAADELAFRDNPATVVVISDGIESCDRDPCALADDLERAGIGFTAHVIGFGLGSDADKESLSCIAQNTGGRFIAAADADELQAALGEVSATVATAPEPEPEPETEPQYDVSITAPETALAGSNIEVSWSKAVAGRDIITIVPAGADEGEIENHIRVKDDSSSNLRVPGEPGLYEVRYVIDEGRRTLASTPVEVTEPEMSVTAPETALAGSNIEVSWSKAVAGRDIITIVPAGADEGEIENHIRVKDDSSSNLRVPGEPGLYEVRYVIDEGRRTLASTPVEVTEPSVQLSATETVRAKAEIDVEWQGDTNSRDIITIVPMGADEGTIETHKRVRSNSSATFKAPAETGMYEVRFVLDEGRRTLASAIVEVVAEDAALDMGGSLDVPETATTGETVQVGWTSSSESSRQRISLAKSNQADFTWIEAQKTDNEPPLMFTMPDEPGTYEFRLLDLAGPSVLSRAIIVVQE
jgi:Ca-activated chloride channel family protein